MQAVLKRLQTVSPGETYETAKVVFESYDALVELLREGKREEARLLKMLFTTPRLGEEGRGGGIELGRRTRRRRRRSRGGSKRRRVSG